MKHNYKELKIWQLAMSIVDQCYSITKVLPSDERYILCREVIRSAISIPSNIAEGCAFNSDKQFVRFLRISLGSTYELNTQLEIVSRQYKDITSNTPLKTIADDLLQLQRMIATLIKKYT